MVDETIHCPFCGQAAATTDTACRYCRYDFSRGAIPPALARETEPDDEHGPAPISYRKIRGRIVGFALVAALAGGWFWNASRPSLVPNRDVGPNLVGQITSTTAKIQPFMTPAGNELRAVSVTIFNAGPRPISEIWGKVTVFAEDGSHTSDGYEHACLYPHTGSSLRGGAIPPGKSVIIPGVAMIGSDRSGDVHAISADVQVNEAYQRLDPSRYGP